MSIDIFADPVSAETDTRQPGNPWPGTWAFVALCVTIVLGVWLLINRPIDPDGDPVDPPSPTPIASGLHVLIVEETSERDRMPASQVAIFSSIPLRKWYDANCAKEDGIVAYRNFDKDDRLEKENEIWRKLRARITLPPPVLLMVDGKRGKEMPLPADPDAMQATLEQFAKSKR